MDTLNLIDGALDAAKEAAHSCRNETARGHYEYVLALIRESWIAESGQNARSVHQVIADVDQGLAILRHIEATCPCPEPLKLEY